MKITFILLVLFLLAGLEVRDIHERDQTKQYIEHLESQQGRPLQYKALPHGQYVVRRVVNEYTQTAVVEKISRADGLVRDEAKQYFFVTDMMPQMMKEGFIFGEDD